jgi:hypothetical protein
VQALRDASFAVCPRGVGTASIRLFEAMRLGVAPVILSDRWVAPRGPSWETFALRWPEGRLPSLAHALAERRDTAIERGELARQAWEEWFAPEVFFDRLVDAADEARRSRVWLSRLVRVGAPLFVAAFRLRLRLRTAIANLVLALRRRRERTG